MISLAASQPTSKSSLKDASNIQAIVRLDNCKSYVLNFDPTCFTKQNVRSKLSHVTGIPFHILKLQSNNNGNDFTNQTSSDNSVQQRFFSASTFLPIRGGKGGFGTLLKGQSKQAGAKRTLDFGACRDLNGRRLRHVNDEIKLRKWRESMRKKMEKAQRGNTNADELENGGIDIEEELEELRTASGIRNWHLVVPNWSEVGGGGLSGKSRRAMERSLRREIQKIVYESKQDMEAKKKKKAAWEDAIVSYANAGESHNKDQEKKMTDSILEGLNKRKKRKLNEGGKKSIQDEKSSDNNDGDDLDSILAASNICTLSGDVVLEEKSITMLVQSRSEFATSAVLLNSSLFKEMSEKQHGLYYEVTLKTCGIAQIGWANLSINDGSIKGFLPNSDTGDGVGDDSWSYGFDGSRGLAFHNGKTIKYGNYKSKKDENPIQWQQGDVIGCKYNLKKGTVEYSMNGKSLGVAYNIEQKDEKQLLHPVFSLNQTEIIELNTGPDFQFAPAKFIGVASFVGNDNAADENNNDDKEKSEVAATSAAATVKKDDSVKPEAKSSEKAEKETATMEEPIELNDYNSANELENLGADRLKKELYRLGCKCGGSLQERAKRLYSTKGLTRSEYPKKIVHPNAKV